MPLGSTAATTRARARLRGGRREPRSPRPALAPHDSNVEEAPRGVARELSPRVRRSLLALVGLVCVAMAWAPLVRTGFHGDDLEYLLRASGLRGAELGSAENGAVEPLPLVGMPPIEVLGIVGDDVHGDVGSLLSGYSIAVSLRLWGAAPTSAFGLPTALLYRIENLAWLALASVGLARFLRRVFAPWTGREQAGFAANTAAYLFFLHPLAIPGVAQVGGRSDVMALAFSTWAAAAFLRGRQDRTRGFVVAAAGLTLLASLSGQLAWMLPAAIALTELACAYRFRPLRSRVRTALNSFVVFFLLVQLNTLVVSTVTGHGYYPRAGLTLVRLGEPGAAFGALLALFEKVGALLIPANLSTLGIPGLVLAGALTLAALQPALVAARAAPRLWGWALAWWLGSMGVALLFGLHERVQLENLADGRSLLPAAAAACAGLGLACTAVHGLRRYALPPLLAIGFAVLANGNARPWLEGAERIERLREDLVFARRAYGPDAQLVVMDAPRAVLGLDPLGEALPDLLHPLFAAEDAPKSESGPRLDARDLPRDGFALLFAQPDLGEILGSEARAGIPVEGPDGKPGGAHAFVALDEVRAQLEDLPSSGPWAPGAFSRLRPFRELTWRAGEPAPEDVQALELLDVRTFAYGRFEARSTGSGSFAFRGARRFVADRLEPPLDPRQPRPDPDWRYALHVEDGTAAVHGQLPPDVYTDLLP